ncbi:MAG: hypothetical protein QF473_33875, partial [Planctomycetota bacterium]|nr:hypothetical protein [Planctomycetota bacterium]
MISPIGSSFVLVFLLVGGVGSASAEPPWEVGFAVPGEALEKEHQDFSKDFLAILARKGVESKSLGFLNPEKWLQSPGLASGKRIAVLAAVRTGTRIQLLVFEAHLPDGTLRLIAHQSASSNPHRRVYQKDRPAFGPGQDFRFAVRRLATLVAQQLSMTDRPPAADRRVNILVDLDANEADPRWRRALKVLAWAASCRAGFAPTTGKADLRLTVSASAHEVLCRVKTTWSEGNETRTFYCENILEPGLFDVVCASVRSVASWNAKLA